jgi:hypothetical protein
MKFYCWECGSQKCWCRWAYPFMFLIVGASVGVGVVIVMFYK